MKDSEIFWGGVSILEREDGDVTLEDLEQCPVTGLGFIVPHDRRQARKIRKMLKSPEAWLDPSMSLESLSAQLSQVYLGRARAAVELGRADDVRSSYDSAVEHALAGGFRLNAAEICEEQGMAESAAGRPGRALRAFEHAMEILHETENTIRPDLARALIAGPLFGLTIVQLRLGMRRQAEENLALADEYGLDVMDELRKIATE